MTRGKVEVSDQMMISAVRYALGRQTYIVAETVDETIRVWDELSPGARNIIARDVRSAMSAGELSDIDAPEWQRLVDVAEGCGHQW